MLDFDHERLVVFADAPTGATGAIALHSTALGPAMGGLRLLAYPSLDAAAGDALRLARAMTLKNAAAGLDLGGGKAVLHDDGHWQDPATRAARMRAVGRVVDELDGRYVTAEDVGTSPQDMVWIGEATEHVAGKPVGLGGRGDPSPVTARTVFGALLAAVELRGLGAGRPAAGDGAPPTAGSLAGVRVGVQGVGHVGAALVALLAQAGAEVVLTDTDAGRAQAVAMGCGAEAMPPEGFVRREVDVLAPCALGAAVTSADLRCAVVCGAANNPLADPALAARLAARDVLYVPDFLANSGGIIHVGAEVLGFDDDEVEALVRASIRRTSALLAEALATGRVPLDLAVARAQARIAGHVAVAA